MIRYNHLFKFKSLINKLLWKYIFSRSFKGYGTGANIYFPENIIGDEYITIGDNVYLGYGASILVMKTDNHEPDLTIGDDSKIRRFFHIVCINKVTIGSNVLIADNVLIVDNAHGYEDVDLPIRLQPLVPLSSVEIGDGTWLGENVCVIGAKIGKHSIVGSNSVVLNDIPDYSVVVGSPARVVKQYDSETGSWIKCSNEKSM